ncbi:MAG: TetR/AcrR family transcriptional regulator C-terminal domain-containing protein [Raoultibacter sp.]
MSSLTTKILLAETFVSLIAKSSNGKISVSDVIAASDKTRKTFYYHFHDRDELIVWIFRHDLANILEEHIDPSQLVYEKTKEGSLSAFPYYACIKKGVRSLDSTIFFQCLHDCIRKRSKYYSIVLQDTGLCSLQHYLFELYTPALKEDIHFILSNRFLKETNIAFLAEFYTGAFISALIRLAATNEDMSHALSEIGPFGNIIHSSLESEIAAQQLRRSL